ncbi:hypothetical protein GCM10018954_017560 [Kutzneria kofuensis]
MLAAAVTGTASIAAPANIVIPVTPATSLLSPITVLRSLMGAVPLPRGAVPFVRSDVFNGGGPGSFPRRNEKAVVGRPASLAGARAAGKPPAGGCPRTPRVSIRCEEVDR